MRHTDSIALDEVKRLLRRGKGARVENFSGWCVFVDAAGQRRFVVDASRDHAPVPFKSLQILRSGRGIGYDQVFILPH